MTSVRIHALCTQPIILINLLNQSKLKKKEQFRNCCYIICHFQWVFVFVLFVCLFSKCNSLYEDAILETAYVYRLISHSVLLGSHSAVNLWHLSSLTVWTLCVKSCSTPLNLKFQTSEGAGIFEWAYLCFLDDFHLPSFLAFHISPPAHPRATGPCVARVSRMGLHPPAHSLAATLLTGLKALECFSPLTWYPLFQTHHRLDIRSSILSIWWPFNRPRPSTEVA